MLPISFCTTAIPPFASHVASVTRSSIVVSTLLSWPIDSVGVLLMLQDESVTEILLVGDSYVDAVEPEDCELLFPLSELGWQDTSESKKNATGGIARRASRSPQRFAPVRDRVRSKAFMDAKAPRLSQDSGSDLQNTEFEIVYSDFQNSGVTECKRLMILRVIGGNP